MVRATGGWSTGQIGQEQRGDARRPRIKTADSKGVKEKSVRRRAWPLKLAFFRRSRIRAPRGRARPRRLRRLQVTELAWISSDRRPGLRREPQRVLQLFPE